MKKAYFLSAIAASILLITSCHSDPENHLLNIVYPNPYGIIFADQENDSVIFESFDSYNITSQDEWISVVAGSSYEVDYDYRNLYAFTSLLSFTPNTTGRTRVGSIRIDSYDYSTAALFYQYGFMNIVHPEPSETAVPDSASFDLYVPFIATEDSICFNVSKPWTLEFAENADNTWATLDKVQGAAGKSKVTVSITPNPDTDKSRVTVLALKCGQVTNLINIRQAAAIKTTE